MKPEEKREQTEKAKVREQGFGSVQVQVIQFGWRLITRITVRWFLGRLEIHVQEAENMFIQIRIWRNWFSQEYDGRTYNLKTWCLQPLARVEAEQLINPTWMNLIKKI